MWEIAAITHRGRVRSVNEDAIAIGRTIILGILKIPRVFQASGPTVLLVADGIGGQAAGDVASVSALRFLIDLKAHSFASNALCEAAIHNANRHLYEMGAKDRALRGMGTTLVGAYVGLDRLVVFNVGDSRAYMHSDDGVAHSAKIIRRHLISVSPPKHGMLSYPSR